MPQEIILIAALSENNVIGIENHLPWTLPADWENFKKVTAGCPFVMGRKSFASEDMLYSTAENIVLSRNPNLALPANFRRAENLNIALELLKDYPRIFILGGEAIFRESLSFATHLYLTQVQAVVKGDTFFPTVDWGDWEKEKSVFYPIDERHEFSFYINEYSRR